MRDVIFKTATQSADDPAEFILSDESVDRMGDVIQADGWDLKNFRRNPIALFNHDKHAIVGVWKNVRVEGDKLLGRLQLAAAGTSRLVDEVRALFEQKILRAVSVGFRALEMEPLDENADKYFGPFRFLKSQLLEASIVAIPANPNALQVARNYPLTGEARRQLFGESANEERRRMPQRESAQTLPPRGTKMKTTLTKQIERIQGEIVMMRDQLTEITGLEDRDADQETLFGELPTMIEDAQKQLARFQAAERALAATAERSAQPAADVTIIPPAGGDAAQRNWAVPRRKLEPADYLFRSIAAGVRAFGQQVPIDQAAREMYGTGDEGFNVVLRAAVNPAQTTVAGWAAELVQTAQSGFLDRLVAESIYGPLSNMGARYDLGRAGSLKIPVRAATPKAAGAWVGEGAPKPVRRIGFGSVTLTPHKLAVISTFTEEMAMSSVPAIEAVLRQALADDTSEALDGFLIDAIAASATRPGGLLNGVAKIPASAATPPTAAMIADLKALVGAIITAGGGRDIAILINPLQAMSIGFAQTTTGDFVFESVDQAGQKFRARFIVSRTVPAGTVIAIDAADFASATGDAPRFAVSNEATLHEEDTTPLALGTGAQGSGVLAVPMRSLFQTDSVAIRLSLFVTWTMRRGSMVAWTDTVLW